MKTTHFGATALALLATGPAFSLGLDRSGQDIGAIFEPGGYAELSFGMVNPSITGTDLLSNDTGNVGLDFTTASVSVKMDINEMFSAALILDQPFGAYVEYEGSPAATLLGGTAADLRSNAITAIGRYRINDNFSVHAGVRSVTMEADVTLSGLAYDGLNGYNVRLDDGHGTGWLAGVAYERPDIALRVALTYNSAIDTAFDTAEFGGRRACRRRHHHRHRARGLEPGFPDRDCRQHAAVRLDPPCEVFADPAVARFLRQPHRGRFDHQYRGRHLLYDRRWPPLLGPVRGPDRLWL